MRFLPAGRHLAGVKDTQAIVATNRTRGTAGPINKRGSEWGDLDLRERVVAAVSGGMSRRQAAERFGVSVASAVRWSARDRQTGSPAAKPRGGDRLSARIEAQREQILMLLDGRDDITLAELQAQLAEQGHRFGIGTLWRFFARHGLTWKKDRARGGARAPRHPEAAVRLVREPADKGLVQHHQ